MLIDLGGCFHCSMQHVQITAHPLVWVDQCIVVAIKQVGASAVKYSNNIIMENSITRNQTMILKKTWKLD